MKAKECGACCFQYISNGSQKKSFYVLVSNYVVAFLVKCSFTKLNSTGEEVVSDFGGKRLGIVGPELPSVLPPFRCFVTSFACAFSLWLDAFGGSAHTALQYTPNISSITWFILEPSARCASLFGVGLSIAEHPFRARFLSIYANTLINRL